MFWSALPCLRCLFCPLGEASLACLPQRIDQGPLYLQKTRNLLWVLGVSNLQFNLFNYPRGHTFGTLTPSTPSVDCLCMRFCGNVPSPGSCSFLPPIVSCLGNSWVLSTFNGIQHRGNDIEDKSRTLE